MPVSRVSALGFYDTRTVTAFGFVDETFTDTTTYVQPSGFSAATNIGAVTAIRIHLRFPRFQLRLA